MNQSESGAANRRSGAASPRLHRSHRDRLVAGVAAGIAHRVGADPIFIRLAFIVTAFAGGFGLIAYAVGWILIPPARPGEELLERAVRRRGVLELVAGGLILLGLLFLLRSSGIWLGDDFVWPALLAAIGIVLLWRRSSPERRATIAAGVRDFRERRLPPVVDELLDRGAGTARSERPDAATIVRIVLGASLLIAGIGAFASANDSFQNSLVAMVILLGGLALVFGPWAWRLLKELDAERRERIRSQERAEMAAHLHDSVLQTLALIQRHPDDSEKMVRLARRQERELRNWLYGGSALRSGTSLAGALELAAAEIEDLHGVPVEAVAVGDCQLDEPLKALLQATREAMVNAARLSGDEKVAVYLEVEPDTVTCFVRDRGVGFDLDSIPPDRKGVSESIIGRMERHGGSATIRTAPGEGTEVTLSLARPDGSKNGDRPEGSQS